MNTEEIPLIDLNVKERSPKTINIGDSKEETEYNLRTLRHKKKTPIRQSKYNMNDNNNMLYQNYSPEEEVKYPIVTPINNSIQNTIDYIGNNQDIQYYMYPRDLKENPLNYLNNNNKLSPQINAIDDTISDIKNDSPNNQLRLLKNQMTINQKYLNNENIDGMNEGRKNIKYGNSNIEKKYEEHSFNTKYKKEKH